jgi:TusA-related sulfurtransferase
MQDRTSLSINRTDTSISKSKQLDSAIPPSKISSLSSGEFVGMVADDPDCKIELKIFHNAISNNHEMLKKEQQGYKPIPVVRQVTQAMIQRNYTQIRQEIEDLVTAEMERIIGDPGMVGTVLKKT